MAGIHHMFAAMNSARLLSQLRFEGPNGGTTFPDDVGVAWTRSANAVLSTSQFRSGESSMHLPNTNGYDGLIGPSTLLVPAGATATKFSIESWVYITDANGFQFGSNPVCGQTISGANGEQWFGLSNGRIKYSRASAHPGGSYDLTGTTVAAINAWHKLKMEFDGDSIQLYLNDTLEATAAASYGWNNPGTAFTVGVSVVTGFEAWRQGMRGYMDDFKAVRP